MFLSAMTKVRVSFRKLNEMTELSLGLAKDTVTDGRIRNTSTKKPDPSTQLYRRRMSGAIFLSHLVKSKTSGLELGSHPAAMREDVNA